MDDFSEEFVRGEAARPDYMVHSGENVALLIDSSERMHKTKYKGPLPMYEGLPLFEVALKQVQDVVSSRLAFGMETELTIIFYNTASTTRDLKGVHVWHPAAPPSVELLERLHNGPFVQFGTYSMVYFRNAVAAAMLEFFDGRIMPDAQTIIATWTCLDGDRHEDDVDDSTIHSVVELFQKRNALLQIVTLDDSVPGRLDQSHNIWSFILERLNHQHKYCSTWSILKDPFGSGDDRLISHANQFGLSRLHGKAKHNSFTLPLHLKSFGTIDMKCSSLTAAAFPKCIGATSWLDSRDSSTLIGKLFEDINQDVTPHSRSNVQEAKEEDPYYPKQMGKKESKAPRVFISKDHIAQMRYPIPKKCAFLIGFKPKAWLEPAWQMREAYFIWPDDNSSVKMREKCTALHRAMAARSVVGICCFVKTDQSEPRLAAILPLSANETKIPLGFSMMELPFADDIRHPEQMVDVLGDPIENTPEGDRLAEDLVRKHPARPEHYPGVAVNPHIQAHFSVLSSLLFEEQELDLLKHCLVSDDGALEESLHLKLGVLNDLKNHFSLHS